MSAVQRHRTVLLIGKTGNGKSTVGNVLLGAHRRDEFPFSEGAYGASETRDLQVEEIQVGDVMYKIVDTIGLCDTREETFDNRDICIKIASACASIGADGIYQVLFVSKGRLTDEEKEVFKIFRRAIFTEEVCNFTTIVRTNCSFFQDTDKCREARRRLETVAQGDDVLLSLVGFKLVFINNLNEEENPDWVAIRDQCRQRLLASLEMSNRGLYKPATLEEMLDRITKYFDQTQVSKVEELEKQMADRDRVMREEIRELEEKLIDMQRQQEENAAQIAKRHKEALKQLQADHEKEKARNEEIIFHTRVHLRLGKATVKAYCQLISACKDVNKLNVWIKELCDGRTRWELLTSGRIAVPRRVVTSTVGSSCVLPHQPPVYEQLSE